MNWLRISILWIFPFALFAQRAEVNGTVQSSSGELLAYANILVLPDSNHLVTDLSGTFHSNLSAGEKVFLVSYIGYETASFTSRISGDTTLKITLLPAVGHLREIVVAGKRYEAEDVFMSTRTGTNVLGRESLFSMPVLLGEADVIKSIQLLPGNVRGIEGSGDVFVRGGAADQNLVLLDGAPVYNASHLMGFLSVFNPDVVENAEVISGGFPAEFGGRLSSVLNVTTESEIAEKTTVSADVGLLASRFKLEQPVFRDKAGFWIAGRRSYADQLFKAMDKRLPYHFYDLNGKIIVRPGPRDHIEISHYGGEDVLDFLRDKNGDGEGMRTMYESQNFSQTFKWVHTGPQLGRTNLAMFRTRYAYDVKNMFKGYELAASSRIEDFGVKMSLERDSVFGKFSVGGGTEWIRHEVSPNVLSSEGTIRDIFQSSTIRGQIVHSLAVFATSQLEIGERTMVNAGVRVSTALTGSKLYAFPEPRVSLRYALSEKEAVKISYSRMVQYIHRISNSTVSTPIDVWTPVTDSLGAQTSHQVSVAWQRTFPEQDVMASVESYYKDMDGLITYEEGTNLLQRTDFSSQLVQGRGKAYGFEFLVKKDAGRFTGWISYTLSWSWRKFEEINEGRWFPARYDRRHNGAIVMQHRIGKRWAASMVWEYVSGARFTPLVGQYLMTSPNFAGMDLLPYFSEINSVKLSDAHRLDVGVKLFSKPARKLQWNVYTGIYNVYNRATPIGVVLEIDEDTRTVRYTQPGLFGLLPFVSFGCKI